LPRRESEELTPSQNLSGVLSPQACLLTILLLNTVALPAQQKKNEITTPAPLLTRSSSRHETRRFSYGGTVTVIGAPEGSVKIEGWPRNEVEITANIELRAQTEEDLNQLAAVNNFVFDEDLNHLSVLTTGTHDKIFMKRVARDFPKRLLGLPWKIDYNIRVPVLTDLEVTAGRGSINLTGIEGAVQISAAESETQLTLTGGTVSVTVANGRVKLKIPARSWRGSGADIRVAAGEIVLEFAPGFSADIDAEILRVGHIEDTSGALEPRERPGLTPQNIKARAGAGGASFRLTVGAGTVYIKKAVISDK